MIHIETSDPDTDEMILNSISDWVVRINDKVDVMVIGFARLDDSTAVLRGWKVDDEGIPLDPGAIVDTPLEDINILIY